MVLEIGQSSEPGILPSGSNRNAVEERVVGLFREQRLLRPRSVGTNHHINLLFKRYGAHIEQAQQEQGVEPTLLDDEPESAV